MIVKIENVETKGFVYYDIGNGRLEKNPYQWVICKEGDFNTSYDIHKVDWDIEEQKSTIREDISYNMNDEDELLFDLSRWDEKEYNKGDYTPLKMLHITGNNFDRVIFIPYYAKVYLLNNEGKTIDTL